MPKVMGILNATPDSFYSHSRYPGLEEGIRRGIEIFEEGADILDIGGESSRPDAVSISEKEEQQRVIPLINALTKQISIPISIDTCKPAIAKAAIECGAAMINDITGFANPEMRKLAAESGVEICVMHMQGTPQTMQKNPSYPEGIIEHLVQWFQERIELLLADGIKKDKIILDPGIGFGKTIADNLKIIQNLRKLREIGFPLLLGISRKSFLSKLLNKKTEDLLSGTLTINGHAVKSGADIIRVHDVKEHKELLKTLDHLQ